MRCKERNRIKYNRVCNYCHWDEKCNRCSKCKIVSYCSKNCQRTHWSYHRDFCTVD